MIFIGLVSALGPDLCSDDDLRRMRRVMEELLRRELRTYRLERLGGSRGGISAGESYETDSGKVFVKVNSDSKAKVMFDGEAMSLKAIMDTNTIRVPKPIKVLEQPGQRGWMFVMEHLQLGGREDRQAELGRQLARLHLHNASLKRREEIAGGRVGPKGGGAGETEEGGAGVYVQQFGFPVPTCCGRIPTINDWQSDWVEFYIRQRLQVQLDLVEKEYGDREARELWPRLQKQVPSFFMGVVIEPALLHGDLWAGNIGETEEGPVTFDPASFYGHHEYELSITEMFGGFSQKFYDAYHSVIPKVSGFQTRRKLYSLFHYLNHWNHFGSGYRQQSIALMRELSRSSTR